MDLLCPQILELPSSSVRAAAFDPAVPPSTLPGHSDSDAGPSNTSIGFTALPTEILLLIFEFLLPYLPKRTGLQVDRIRSLTREFCRDVVAFAKLRLLCITWNQIMTPMLYEEVIIFTYPFSRLHQMIKAFDYGAPHIRSVVLCSSASAPEFAQMTEMLVGRGLALCPLIRNLEIHGSQCIFTRRRWLQKTAPRLSSAVTSLTVTGTSNVLSHSLVGLGRNLQTLEIRDWICSPHGQNLTPTFHLPNEMPNLTNLTIRGTREKGHHHIPFGRVVKLFERILVKRNAGTKRTDVPLRSLAFLGVSISTQGIVALLQINQLGSHLTSLHVSFSSSHLSHDSASPVPLVKACPMLVNFCYTAPVGEEIFQQLPFTLRRLGLHIHTESTTFTGRPSADDFTKYLRSERARSLQTLYVLHGSYVFDRTALKSVCDGVGVVLLYSPTDVFW